MNELFLFNTPIIHVRFASNFAVAKISQLLQEKGMKAEVALQRAISVYSTESHKASLYINNFQVYFDKEIMQKVYDYIATKALFQEQINFASYDQMLRLAQQVYNSSLSEEELKQIKHIAKANSYSIALVR